MVKSLVVASSLACVVFLQAGCGNTINGACGKKVNGACGNADYDVISIGSGRTEVAAADVKALDVALDNTSVTVRAGQLGAPVVINPVLAAGDSERVQLVVARNRDDGTLAIAGQADADLSGVRVEIQVPPNTGFRIALSKGDVDLAGMVEGGQVAIDEGSARLSLAPGSDIDVATSKGDITVELPAETDATLQAASQHGRVSIIGHAFQGTQTPDAVDGTIGRGGDRLVHLAADTGDVLVTTWPAGP